MADAASVMDLSMIHFLPSTLASGAFPASLAESFIQRAAPRATSLAPSLS
jgi:hypothetical protein